MPFFVALNGEELLAIEGSLAKLHAALCGHAHGDSFSPRWNNNLEMLRF